MLRTLLAGVCRSAPRRGGYCPRSALLLVLIAFGVPAACTNGSADQVLKPVAEGIASNTPPYYSDGNLTLYEAQTPVELPVRQPTAAELAALGPAPSGTPYPHAPYLRAEDESLDIQYVITNTDEPDASAGPNGDGSQTVWLLIDPWNEFVRYRPGVTVVDDDETIPNLGYDLGFVVPPNARIEGTITADDMREIAIKLASTEKLLASTQAAESASASDNSLSTTVLANHIFDQENRSNSGDPLFTPWIPPVIAGLTGFDLGLRTSGSANIAVQIIVEVQDLNGNRFVVQDSSAKEIGIPPTVLSPPSARF
jgi:hypothetical protein